MLKLCESIRELDFLPADPFCAKIEGYAVTYGTDYDFAKFYHQESDAALSWIDGNVTLWCSKNADMSEIRGFLDFIGYSSVQSTEEVILSLFGEVSDSSYIVKYISGAVCKPENYSDSCDLKLIYSLLTDSGFELGRYDAFVTDVCSRINSGTASFGCIAENNCPVACAFRLFENEKAVLLGAVATAESHRGKGLASSLVPYMAGKTKPAFLFCRNDSLRFFYENCGFSAVGRWAVKNK